MAEFSSVCVMGLGYIGLPTAAVFASRGVKVHGVDVNENAVNTINQGKIHIVEPDLDMLVQSAVNVGNLKASLEPAKADAFIVAVPTPFKDDHVPDLAYIESATKAIAPYVEKGNLIILESTSPVGATEQMAQWLAEARADLNVPTQPGEGGDVYIAHCPERVLPGYVVRELVSNDRIIGGINPESAEQAKALYQTFVVGDCLTTNARTAEMAKLTENAFRDVNIAYANELSLICDDLNINVWELIQLANRHPRVNILQPGPGVGGHCIAVDPWFIVSKTPNTARIIRTAREVNDGKPGWVIEKVKSKADRFKTPVVACLGLAFKPDIDDLRESPAMDIVERLSSELPGAKLLVSEPNISEMPKRLLEKSNLQFVSGPEAVKAADIVLLLVDHKAYKDLDTEQLKSKILIDTRGFWQFGIK